MLGELLGYAGSGNVSQGLAITRACPRSVPRRVAESTGAKRSHLENSRWSAPLVTNYLLLNARPRGRPKKTWTEVVQKDYQARKLDRESQGGCHGSQ